MSSQNVVNVNVPKSYYQIRDGMTGGKTIYHSRPDYQYFLSLLEQNLIKNDSVEALAYCLEPNHFNLLLNQTKGGGIEKLMHNVVTEYNKYYFDKHRVEDLLSETDYKIATVVADDLLEASRSIHTQIEEWMDCPYSSIRAYFYDDVPKWVNKKHIANLYGSAIKYLKFLEDYTALRKNTTI